MTCIVGLVENGKVLLAGDSAGVSLEHQEIYTLRNAKVFLAGCYAIGYTTSYRLGQILRYETRLPEPEPGADLEAFLSTHFVAALRSAFDTAGFERPLGLKGSILVGLRGRLFALGNELQVMSEDTPYAAVGSGRHIAYGALYALDQLGPGAHSPRQRAEVALRAAQRFNPGVREPFHFVEV